MIGATGVQGLAAELEAAIRDALDAATIEARLCAVEAAQAATVAAIYRLPGPMPWPPPRTPPRAQPPGRSRPDRRGRRNPAAHRGLAG